MAEWSENLFAKHLIMKKEAITSRPTTNRSLKKIIPFEVRTSVKHLDSVFSALRTKFFDIFLNTVVVVNPWLVVTAKFIWSVYKRGVCGFACKYQSGFCLLTVSC